MDVYQQNSDNWVVRGTIDEIRNKISEVKGEIGIGRLAYNLGKIEVDTDKFYEFCKNEIPLIENDLTDEEIVRYKNYFERSIGRFEMVASQCTVSDLLAVGVLLSTCMYDKHQVSTGEMAKYLGTLGEGGRITLTKSNVGDVWCIVEGSGRRHFSDLGEHFVKESWVVRTWADINRSLLMRKVIDFFKVENRLPLVQDYDGIGRLDKPYCVCCDTNHIEMIDDAGILRCGLYPAYRLMRTIISTDGGYDIVRPTGFMYEQLWSMPQEYNNDLPVRIEEELKTLCVYQGYQG